MMPYNLLLIVVILAGLPMKKVMSEPTTDQNSSIKQKVASIEVESKDQGSSTLANPSKEQQRHSDGDKMDTEFENSTFEMDSPDSDEDEEENDLSDIYDKYMEDLYESAYIAKCMIMMIHFGNYVHKTMDFDHVRDDRTPVTFKQRLDKFNYPTFSDVFTGMYAHYAIMSSMLSLKACAVYFDELNTIIADECSRYLRYSKAFLEAHTTAELFFKNPLKNDQIGIPPVYEAKDILEKLMDTKRKVDEALNQDFNNLIGKDMIKTMHEKPIHEDEIAIDKSSPTLQEPHPNLDRMYTLIWELLLDPVKENFIIFNNYFNEAMNINHFITSTKNFVQLPESRRCLTTAWQELATLNHTLKNTNFVNLVFYGVSKTEMKRIECNTLLDEGGNEKITPPETLYKLVDIVPSKGELRGSNFFVVV